MTTTQRSIGQYLQDQQVWLFGLLGSVALFHLYAVWHIKADLDLLSIQALFWGTAGYLLWERRDKLTLESDPISTVVGLGILGVVLLKTTAYFTLFTQVSPFLSLLAVLLMMSGFRGLGQYKQELLVMFIYASSILVETLIYPYLGYLSLATAKFGNSMLVYAGYDAVREGTNIRLPTGVVDVYVGCSGIESMLQTLRLSFLFLLLFPIPWFKAVFVPFVAIIVAFMVNGVRVALMAVLVAGGDRLAFDYWHEGEGSNLFSLITMMIFGLFCRFLLPSEEEPAEPETP